MGEFNTNYLLNQLVLNAKNNPKAIGYQKLTVSSTAVKLTLPANTRYALIAVESDVTTGFVIRCLQYGGAPTTTVGMPLSHGDRFDILDAKNLVDFTAIQTQAGTHALNIEYYS